LQDVHYNRFFQQPHSVGKSIFGQKPHDPKNTQPVSRGRGGLETNMGTCTHWNQGTESADKVAEEALHEEPASVIRATENDWIRWTKEVARKKERNEWLASGERMVEIKPNIKK
jgi:hypothetical protein